MPAVVVFVDVVVLLMPPMVFVDAVGLLMLLMVFVDVVVLLKPPMVFVVAGETTAGTGFAAGLVAVVTASFGGTKPVRKAGRITAFGCDTTMGRRF